MQPVGLQGCTIPLLKVLILQILMNFIIRSMRNPQEPKEFLSIPLLKALILNMPAMSVDKMVMVLQSKMFEYFIHWTSFCAIKFRTLHRFIRANFLMVPPILKCKRGLRNVYNIILSMHIYQIFILCFDSRFTYNQFDRNLRYSLSERVRIL